MVSQKISKEVFVQVIEHLHQQYLPDKEYVDGISAVFGTDMPFYDNSHLLKSSLELLRRIEILSKKHHKISVIVNGISRLCITLF